ncbi:MAG: VOC family protein [Gammaproteobacteria bacterium]|nr:MAG: VOC family protein [Gammaproteobacteria bacterium]
MEDNPSILSHVSVGTNDFDRATQFYDAVLPSVGCRRIMEHPGAVAYGRVYPEFWVQTPIDSEAASVGNGFHIGFFASSKKAVDDFHRAACWQRGAPYVIVLGNPGYYARFGFQAASKWQLANQYGAGPEFMLVAGRAGALPRQGAVVKYGREFSEL